MHDSMWDATIPNHNNLQLETADILSRPTYSGNFF